MPIYYRTTSDGSNINAVTTPQMMVHLGEFSLRAGNRYLDVRTSIGDNMMMYFESWGYLYNRGMHMATFGSYSYAGGFINTFYYNYASTTILRVYRASASPNSVCMKFDSNDNGYSEGRINIFYAVHGLTDRPTVTGFAENNSSSNYY